MASLWEYKTVYNENKVGSPANYKAPDAMLNTLGLQEWELVSVTLWVSPLTNRVYEIFYLKRVPK